MRHTSINCKRNETMNKDQIKGRLEQVKGKAKEITGNVVGNNKLKSEGQMEKIAGKVQSNLGDAKEAVKDKVKDLTKHG
jgi:uncharacterized protein YjbJ (UPF0337 family)